MATVTKSQPQDIVTPLGNMLSVFVDGETGILSLKDVYGNIQPVSDYIEAQSGGSGINYSLEEQVIGTWIDGKPLYSKVQVIVGDGGFFITVDLTALNVKDMISISGFANRGDETIFVNAVRSASSMVIGGWATDGGDRTLYLQKPSGAPLEDGLNYYLFIEYTKTTD